MLRRRIQLLLNMSCIVWSRDVSFACFVLCFWFDIPSDESRRIGVRSQCFRGGSTNASKYWKYGSWRTAMQHYIVVVI